jgi:diguanylate cyclase (GGDEF)-like protein
MPAPGHVEKQQEVVPMEQAAEEPRIRSLAAMARVLGRSQELSRLLEVAAEGARAALRASSVSVSRLEPASLTVRTIVNVGDLGPHEERWPADEIYALDHFSNLALVVDELQTWTAVVEDPDGDPSEQALLVELGKGASVGAPIVVDGQLWGELYATRSLGQTPFGANDIAYLDALTAILAGAISRSIREESLERLAYRDPLTGLLNRRALDEYAARAFEVGRGVSRESTVVAVDINGLKQVNDSLGHVGGDRLIQTVARALTTAFNRVTGSLVARVGGDEFTVLVSGHAPAQVVELADRLCRRSWEFGSGAGVSCGAAAGVVTDASTLTPSDLFAAADRAQYVAKRGRLASTVLADGFGPAVDPGAREEGSPRPPAVGQDGPRDRRTTSR